MAKARVIMRHKLNLILEGIKPVANDYTRLAELPQKYTGANANDFSIWNHTPFESDLCRDIRQLAATYLKADQQPLTQADASDLPAEVQRTLRASTTSSDAEGDDENDDF